MVRILRCAKCRVLVLNVRSSASGGASRSLLINSGRKPDMGDLFDVPSFWNPKAREDDCHCAVVLTSKPFTIWQLGDEYERARNDCQKKYWRRRLFTKTTMLVMKDSSSASLRRLKRKHKIDKNRQQIETSQITLSTAFTAASTITNLVTRFKASVFRCLFIRWSVIMHIALTCERV
jgi:hypothetical protein